MCLNTLRTDNLSQYTGICTHRVSVGSHLSVSRLQMRSGTYWVILRSFFEYQPTISQIAFRNSSACL